ncbi:RNA-binding S4 domain-containing protein [Desulfobulbus propionicus]|jgi:ribosome-associated protein
MTMTEHCERLAAISTPFIELDKLLKREGLAASGGEARYLISAGMVEVNGQVETRKRRKLYPDDTVFFNGVRLRVRKTPPPLDPESGAPGEGKGDEKLINGSI